MEENHPTSNEREQRFLLFGMTLFIFEEQRATAYVTITGTLHGRMWTIDCIHRMLLCLNHSKQHTVV